MRHYLTLTFGEFWGESYRRQQTRSDNEHLDVFCFVSVSLNENVLLEAKQPKVSKLKHSCPNETKSGDTAHFLSGERGSSIQLHDCCLKLRLFFAWKTNFTLRISSKSPHGGRGMLRSSTALCTRVHRGSR